VAAGTNNSPEHGCLLLFYQEDCPILDRDDCHASRHSSTISTQCICCRRVAKPSNHTVRGRAVRTAPICTFTLAIARVVLLRTHRIRPMWSTTIFGSAATLLVPFVSAEPVDVFATTVGTLAGLAKGKSTGPSIYCIAIRFYGRCGDCQSGEQGKNCDGLHGDMVARPISQYLDGVHAELYCAGF
jgi:hypothetical protein